MYNIIITMGIKGLNTFFKDVASAKSIQYYSFEQLRGKTIVVDTSIYIYKFLEHGLLLENMYIFITQCLELNITPLFVFDGKPNHMKKDLLINRSKKKLNAHGKYSETKEKYEAEFDNLTQTEKVDLWSKLSGYKKRSIRVHEQDIIDLKALMDALGVYHCDAPNEADVVCAYFVLTNIAWACVSDDMDMFAYCCPRVLRDWKINTKTTVLYDFESLKKDIKIPNTHIRDVFLLVGNDYMKHDHLSIETILKWYRDFELLSETSETFYGWLKDKSYITEEKFVRLNEIIPLYDIPVWEKEFDVHVKDGVKIENLQTLLAPCGFVFIV